MTGETNARPPTFGRWQQPAALANAGLVPPDPYPLEEILYCATCHQQFFGTHQTGGVRVYRTACTCRPGPLPASEVEPRVYAETHVLTFGTDPVTSLTNAHYALLAVRSFTCVELGSTVNDITFTARI